MVLAGTDVEELGRRMESRSVIEHFEQGGVARASQIQWPAEPDRGQGSGIRRPPLVVSAGARNPRSTTLRMSALRVVPSRAALAFN